MKTNTALQYGHFDRSKLPDPKDYYVGEFGELKIRGDWANVCCPIHKDGQEKRPSMSVNVIKGCFNCHACGVKGGDILAFHRLKYNLDFKEAAEQLGAWL